MTKFMGFLTLSRFILALACALAMASAYAQEEGLIDGSTSSATAEPPPIAGAWAGSAAANVLLEDGAFIPSRRSPWGVSWFNWANVNMKNYREGSGRLETYNYLSMDYRLNWESKVSIRPEFYVSGAGKDFFGDDVEGETEMGDIYAQYTHNSWALLPGDIGLSGSARIYYPNNKFVKQQRQITRLQARLIFQRPLGAGVWVSYHFRPMYLVQRQQAYLNDYFNAKANEHYRLEQWLEFTKPISRNVAVSQQFGVEHRRYYDSPANNIEARTDGFVSMSTSVGWFLNGVSFRGGLSYESKIARPDRDSQIYNEAETKYFLMTNVRL
ncbi:MAG: hypothetical protein AB7N80_02675 [Bdellovibrionales bacterium]